MIRKKILSTYAVFFVLITAVALISLGVVFADESDQAPVPATTDHLPTLDTSEDEADVCAQLDDPTAYFNISPAMERQLRQQCERPLADSKGQTAHEQSLNSAYSPTFVQMLGTDVPVNDRSGDSGGSLTQSTTTIALNESNGTVCSAYIDGVHGSEGDGYVGFSRSTDSGASFTDNGAIDATVVNYGNPSLIWRESDGYFYLAALLGDDDGTGIWRSTDDCQTFAYYGQTRTLIGDGLDDMEILVVDNHASSPYYGRFYMTWLGEFSQIQIAYSDDAQTWSDALTLSNYPNQNTESVQTPWVTVAPNGDVFASWVHFYGDLNTPPWTYDVNMVRSTDGGTTYADVTMPVDNALVPHESSTECRLYSWNPALPALNGGIRYYPAPPQLVAGADGTLHLVYSYDPDGYDTGDVVNVYYRQSTDNGQTWGAEIQLNDDATTTDQFFPTVSVSDNGRVVTTWYDRRNDTANNYFYEYYMSVSHDNGQTWSTNEKVSDTDSAVVLDPFLGVTCYHGFYDQNIQDNDTAYIQWSDDRNGDADVFLDTFNFPEDFAISATPSSQEACTSGSASYDINLASIRSYADNVTLSVSGEPAGSTISITDNPVTPPGTTDFSVSNLGGSAAGSYTLDVVGTGPTSTHTTTVQLDLFATTPGAATLTAPADTATDVPSLTEFSWTAVANASSYTLEIATDAGFSNIVHSETTENTSLTPAFYLEAGTTYYWRITADNACGNNTSSSFSLTTAAAASVLLVNDSDTSPNVTAYYTETLDALTVSYDVWETNLGVDKPTEADLAAYDTVIWFTGDRYSSGPDVPAEAALSNWLDQDNCFILSSQSYLNTINAFRSQYLGLRSWSNPYPAYTSVTGDWVVFGGLGAYDMSYPFYGQPKRLYLNEEVGHSAFTSEVGIAGSTVYNDNGRATYWGFPFETITNLADRQEVMSTAFDWCQNGIVYGSISGNVIDADYGWPLEGAVLTADDGSLEINFSTDINGDYAADLRIGTYDLTVAATDYQSQTVQVTINDGATTVQDFALQGGTLSHTPDDIEEFMEPGDVVTNSVTLDVSGPLPVTANLIPYTTLADRVYGVYADNTQLHLAHFNRATPGTLTSLNDLSSGYLGGDFFGTDFSQVYAIAANGFDNSDDELVSFDTSTGAATVIGTVTQPEGFEQYQGMAYDPVTDQMYVVSSYVDFFSTGGATLYTIDLNTAETTVVGSITNPFAQDFSAIAFDGDGNLYGHDTWNQALVSIDMGTLQSTTIAQVDMFVDFNSGLDWDPVSQQMMFSVFTYANGGELRTIDLTTAETTLIAPLGSVVPGTPEETAFTFIAYASAPLPWATVSPDNVSIAANGSTSVDVTLDSTALYELGDYTGAIAFDGTYVNILPSMPLTMHLSCAACGVLDGAITDAWFETPVNANLNITGGPGMDIHVAGTEYEVTVQPGAYTIEVSADGYLDQTVNVTAVANSTVTTDIELIPEASYLNYGPDSIDVSAELGEMVTRTVTVSNTGTVPLTFDVRMDNIDVPVSLRNASLAAINNQQAHAPEAPIEIDAYGLRGETVGSLLSWYELANPEFVEDSGVYHDHGSMRGGDFFAEDFSKLYAFEESKLISLDMETGEKQYIGALPMVSTYSAYRGMAYNPVNGQMYIMHSYNCNAFETQTLYTVDVTTAAVTAVGEVTGMGCINAIAISDTGVMYGIDIDNDVLITIDTDTAEATIIGAIGTDVATFSQGLDWDSATNQLYYGVTDPSTFPQLQKLYTINPDSGLATYLGIIGENSHGGAFVSGLAIKSEAVKWATLPTDTIVVPPDTTATFDIVFDARSMVKTGDYLSEVIFEGNFINEADPLSVALHLSCTDCATLDGAITDANAATALNANLSITGPNGFDVTLFSKDTYDLTVQPGEYTITVESVGYASEMETVTAVANTTTTTDFALISTQTDIDYLPGNIDEVLGVGETSSQSFTITNNGVESFEFVVQDTESVEITSTVAITSCGAADGFGYQCIDSNTTDGPIFNWVDISSTGTPLGLSGANDYVAPLDIPFGFTYYGAEHDQIAVSSYGQIYFADQPADPTFVNQTIPMTITGGVQNFIALYWDSIRFDETTETHYEVQGVAPYRRVIVQWTNVGDSAYPNPEITMQAILFEESGNILMQYNTLSGATGHRATIGIQGDEQTGLEYGFNEAVLSDNLAICYVHPDSDNFDCALEPPDAAWLTQTPTTGSVAAEESTNVDVMFDATNLMPGLYNADIFFGGAENEPMVLPVTMRVLNFALSADPVTQDGESGETVQYMVTVENISASEETFTLDVAAIWDAQVLIDGEEAPDNNFEITLDPAEQLVFAVLVTVPNDAESGDMDTAVVTVTSQTYAEATSSLDLTTTYSTYTIFLPMISNSGN